MKDWGPQALSIWSTPDSPESCPPQARFQVVKDWAAPILVHLKIVEDCSVNLCRTAKWVYPSA